MGLDEESSEFICRNTFDHPYPTTKLMWIPDTKGVYPDLLATSGDYLRVWRVSGRSTGRWWQLWTHRAQPGLAAGSLQPGEAGGSGCGLSLLGSADVLLSLAQISLKSSCSQPWKLRAR